MKIVSETLFRSQENFRDESVSGEFSIRFDFDESHGVERYLQQSNHLYYIVWSGTFPWFQIAIWKLCARSGFRVSGAKTIEICNAAFFTSRYTRENSVNINRPVFCCCWIDKHKWCLKHFFVFFSVVLVRPLRLLSEWFPSSYLPELKRIFHTIFVRAFEISNIEYSLPQHKYKIPKNCCSHAGQHHSHSI